jgi:hypothetical protein
VDLHWQRIIDGKWRKNYRHKMINWISARESPFQTLQSPKTRLQERKRETETENTKVYVALRKKENTFSQI